MALLSANSAKGAKGKSRSAGEKKRGLPVTSKTGAIVLYGGVNITSEDKEKIKKGLKKFYLKKDGEKTLINAYKKTLCEYYSKEIEQAELEGEYAQVPTYRQFLYWKKQLVKPEMNFVQEQMKVTTRRINGLCLVVLFKKLYFLEIVLKSTQQL